MHGEHRRRRISLLIHAAPGGGRGFEEGCSTGKYVKGIFSGDVMWADLRLINNKSKRRRLSPSQPKSAQSSTLHDNLCDEKKQKQEDGAATSKEQQVSCVYVNVNHIIIL